MINKLLYKNKVSIEARSAIIFTLSTFLCKGINIITTPIFTRILTTYEMGIVTTYNSWYTLLYVIVCLSLDSGSFNIAMMEYKDDRYGYMSSILTLSTLSTIILSSIYLLFRNFWVSLFDLNNTLMILMIISFLFLPATTFWILHQRYEYKYISTAIITLLSTGGSTIVATICTYIASKKNNYNLADIRLISGNIILIIWGIIFYIHIFFKGRIGFSKKYWKFVLNINTPLLIHSMAKNVLDISDRTMISYFIGKSSVGIYGVLYSVSTLALIVWSAINASLIPYMFKNITLGNTDKISKFVEKMLIIYSIVCIFLTLIAPEILKILATSEYFEGIYMMPPIAAGIFFTSLYNIYSNLLLYYKKTKYIMASTLIAALVNLILNYIFINIIGYQAAAYTTLVSYIILAFMQFIFLKKINKSKHIFNNIKIWIIAIITCIVCILINILYIFPTIRYTVIGCIIVVSLILKKSLIKIIK